MDLNIYHWVYFSISIYAFLFLYFINTKITRKIFITLTTCHLFFVQGFRYINVGTDLGRYYTHFIDIANNPWVNFNDNRFGIGYNFLVKTFSSLNLNFQNLLITASAFNFIILSFIIYKYSLNPYISYVFYLLLGLYDFGFSGLRQSISMTIILISFHLFSQKKYSKSFIVTLIAGTFHTTSLIFLIVYAFSSERIIKNYKKIFPMILLVVLLFSKQLVNLMSNIISGTYQRYFGGQTESFFGTTFILLLIFILTGIYFKKRIGILAESRIYEMLLIVSTIALLIQFFSVHSYLFTRINMYFFQIIILYVSYLENGLNMLLCSNNQIVRFNTRFLIFFLIATIGFILFDVGLQGNPHDIVPHSFYWD